MSEQVNTVQTFGVAHAEMFVSINGFHQQSRSKINYSIFTILIFLRL